MFGALNLLSLKITMGGEGKSDLSLETVWDKNRRCNPYDFFVQDLLCDVILTVSSGDASYLGVDNSTTLDNNVTKNNVSPFDLSASKPQQKKRSFKAHRLILACHSEYFHRMFVSCGMREVTGEVNRLSTQTIWKYLIYKSNFSPPFPHSTQPF